MNAMTTFERPTTQTDNDIGALAEQAAHLAIAIKDSPINSARDFIESGAPSLAVAHLASAEILLSLLIDLTDRIRKQADELDS